MKGGSKMGEKTNTNKPNNTSNQPATKPNNTGNPFGTQVEVRGENPFGIQTETFTKKK
jgi:hypothetical protein